MSSTPLTPNSSPSVYPSSSDNSTTTTPPPSDPSALPPTPDSSPPNSSTPRSAPPPTNSPPVSVTPPPSKSEPPTSPPPGVIPPPSPPPLTLPASSPPPSIPPPATPSTTNAPPPSIPPPATPPTTNAPPPSIPSPVTPSTPIAPLPSIPTPVAPSTPSAPPSAVTPSTPNAPPPFIPPPITPSTPSAPPPIDISPPPPIVPQFPPPKNSPSRPSPSPPLKPEVPPPSPPAVIPPSPSPPVHTSPPPSLPVPPKQSLPTPAVAPPPADLSAPPDSEVLSPPNTTFPPPSVPVSATPSPPRNNTPIPPSPTTASTPSTPTENAADYTPPSTNGTTASTTTEAGGFPAGGAIAIVFVGLLALSLLVFSAWFVQTRKKKRTGLNQGYMAPSPFVSSQNSDSIFLPDQNAAIGSAYQSPHHSAHLNGSSSTTKLAYTRDPSGIGNSVPWFTYEELIEATNGFSEENLLGEGGFGCVYKGNLADGREVAVKQLKIGGKQGEREFRAEVEIISRIHHRHLVSIVGYCISDIQRLLVYDYVPNNTLHYHLHGNVSVMTWETRLKVATGAARGIAYLHEDCTPLIIHRDIKSANILLDSNFEAKVADFGLAKLALELEAHAHVSTRVMGTFGCMAPEYATTGKLTEKSDVFSFGVVLLELITGRKPVDSSQPLGDESLVGWARPLLSKALETEVLNNLVDPRLASNYVKIQMLRLTEAAAACVRHSALKRPKMSQVVRALDSIVEISDLSNGMKPGDSQIIDSREQSAQISMFQRMAFGSQEYGTDFSSNSRSSWSGL